MQSTLRSHRGDDFVGVPASAAGSQDPSWRARRQQTQEQQRDTMPLSQENLLDYEQEHMLSRGEEQFVEDSLPSADAGSNPIMSTLSAAQCGKKLVAPPVPELEFQAISEYSIRDRVRYLARKRLAWIIVCSVLFVMGLVVVCAEDVRTGYGFYFWADASKGWSWIALMPIWILVLLFAHRLVGSYTDRELELMGYDIESEEGEANLAEYRKIVGMRCSCCASLSQSCAGCRCGGMKVITEEEKLVEALQSGLPVDSDGELLMEGGNMAAAPAQQAGMEDDERQLLLRGSAAEANATLRDGTSRVNGRKLMKKKDLLGRDRCCCFRVCCPVFGSFLECALCIPKYILFVWTAFLLVFIWWSCITNIYFAIWYPAGEKARTRLNELFASAEYAEVPWHQRYARTADNNQKAVACANRQADYGGHNINKHHWNSQENNEHKKVDAVKAGSWYSHEELAGKAYNPNDEKWLKAFKYGDGTSVLDKTDPTAAPIYADYTAGELMEIHRRNNWVPRKIWLFWHSGWDAEGKMLMTNGKEADAFTVLCLYKIKMLHPEAEGWKVNLISTEWMKKNFPEEERGVITLPVHQAIHEGDRARIAVLRRYGGIYMDVTTILTRSFQENGLVANLAPSRMPHKAIKHGGKIDYMGKGLSEMTVFAMPDNCPKMLRPFIQQVENWMIAAPPQSYYLEMWDQEQHFAWRRPLENGEREPHAMNDRYMERVKKYGCFNSFNDGIMPGVDGGKGTEYKKAYSASYLLFCANGPENAYRGYNFQTTHHASDQTIFLTTALTAGAILWNSAEFQLTSDRWYGLNPLFQAGVGLGYPNVWGWVWFTEFYERIATQEHIKIAGKHVEGGSYWGAITEGIPQATYDSIFFKRLVEPLMDDMVNRREKKHASAGDLAQWKKYAEDQWKKTVNPDRHSQSQRARGSSCGA